MTTYEFPYGAGEWDAVITVELTDEEAALLEESMRKDIFFHLDEDPSLREIDRKVSDAIFEANKRMMLEDGRLDDPEDEDAVYNELGNYSICLPNAFD